MRNKVIIQEDSGLPKAKHQRALESLTSMPLDILNVFQELNEARFYSKLKLNTEQGHQGINWSHLSFCLESQFYQLIFNGELRAHNSPGDYEQYYIYNGSRRVLEVDYFPHQHFPRIQMPSDFTFYLECEPNQLLGPDGNPLFPRS